MIIPGMVSVTFRQKTADDILKLCQEGKLKAIEWSEHAHIMPGDPAGAQALYEKTKAAGLEIAAYGSYYRLGENENPREQFLPSLTSAKALHAPLIRIWAGSQPSVLVSPKKRQTMAKEADLICSMALEAGIQVALEWHRNTLTDTNASAVRFLSETSHHNLSCLWQPTIELSVEERKEGLRLLQTHDSGDRLRNLHIYYWLGETRRPLAEGITVWKQYLSQIQSSADRFGLLEFVKDDSEEQFLEDAKTLHDLLK